VAAKGAKFLIVRILQEFAKILRTM